MSLFFPFRKAVAALALAGLAVPAVTAPAYAEQARDGQGDLRRELRQGNVLSPREIEKKVIPRMKGARYLGPEFDSGAMIYRLKFMKDGGRVVFVDVDARTGRILRTSG